MILAQKRQSPVQDYFRRRRGPRFLKPKAPNDCPECCQEFSQLPLRPKPKVVPWTERKSPRGRPKIIDTSGHACLNPLCDYFAVADAEIHALVSNGSHIPQLKIDLLRIK